MVARREKIYIAILTAALLGVLLLLSLLGWHLWRESVVAEERRLGQLARNLGEETEAAIIDAREMLDWLNGVTVAPCTPPHLELLQETAIARPHIRAISYRQAAQRQCGVGFIQGLELTPPRASRIYDTGVIAWWPGPATAVGGVELFLMRYGEHDVAIDPRLLLNAGPLDDQQAGLWVEGLLMATRPSDAELPEPSSLQPGLTMDRKNDRILARFSLGTLFPIDIVAVQPIGQFWQRYLPTLVTTALLGLLAVGLWLFGLTRYSRHHLSLAAELKAAIEHRQIRVLYQPIVELATGRCVGAEALARWTREDGDEVSPDVFVPIAEKAGLVSELTQAVLEGILRELGGQLKEFPSLSINLNLAPEDLATDSLAEKLSTALKAIGVPASAIKLEITERALIATDPARRQIQALRTQGHQIAIDDFGTGYSSLSYLESFDLDALKIDKSFVDGIDNGEATGSIITHVIDMAKSLDLDIIAEGIEHSHQADWLRNRGVGLGQGYLFSKPLSAKHFTAFYREQH